MCIQCLKFRLYGNNIVVPALYYLFGLIADILLLQSPLELLYQLIALCHVGIRHFILLYNDVTILRRLNSLTRRYILKDSRILRRLIHAFM